MMLTEMHVRVGGDPRGFVEFTALLDELAKLGHPACPVVDWVEVERLCMTLFHRNGAELQGAAAFTVACSQLYGPQGMVQGLSLIERLVGEWRHCWPTSQAARLEILAWLFAQLRVLLRSLEGGVPDLSALGRLEQVMASLDRQLESRLQQSFVALHALREQLGHLSRRLPRQPVMNQVSVPFQPALTVGQALLRPMIVVTPFPVPEERRRRGRLVPWVFVMGVVVASAAGGTWWLARQEPSLFPGLSWPVRVPPEPVRVNSLSLFEAGSVELRPDSTRLLIDALADIKTQPGRLVVITGHTDATGDAEHNQRLSHARASAVRDWMRRMGGIPDRCFVIQGLAASQPIASNDSEAGRAANRRVDIRLMPQQGACG